MRDQLEALVAKFNARVAKDERLRAELHGIERTVVLDLKDGTKYHFVLKDAHIGGILDGGADRPDVTIASDRDTVAGLLSGEIGPFKAYATGRLKVKGDIEDLVRFRKFF
jgi:putative sterol carrier protein